MISVGKGDRTLVDFGDIAIGSGDTSFASPSLQIIPNYITALVLPTKERLVELSLVTRPSSPTGIVDPLALPKLEKRTESDHGSLTGPSDLVHLAELKLFAL